jgi:hypothetical protein
MVNKVVEFPNLQFSAYLYSESLLRLFFNANFGEKSLDKR